MSLEEESKYDYDFLKKVGGLLQTLFEDYNGECGIGKPFKGETFESVYNKVKELVEDEKMDSKFWTELRADFLASDLIYWHYLAKVKGANISFVNDTKEKMMLKWALTNGHYKFMRDNNFDDEFERLIDMFGLEDKTWITRLSSGVMRTHGIKLNDLTDFPNLSRLYLTQMNQTAPDHWLNTRDRVGNGHGHYIHTSSADISFFPILPKLVYLDLSFNSIRDISSLQYLTNLVHLELRHNPIADISPLATLTNLRYLDLSHTSVCNLHPLARITDLEGLIIRGKVIDVSPLADLINLLHLDLSGNRISDISPLAGLTKLTRLILYRNEINDAKPLASLVNLVELQLDGAFTMDNAHTDISPLAGLVKLEILSLCCDRISDISPLKGLVNLVNLNLKNNHVSDVSPLAGLTKLKRLILYENNITKLSPLAGFSSDLNFGIEFCALRYITDLDSVRHLIRSTSAW